MFRFGWVFYLMGLLSAISGLVIAMFSICNRLASGISGFIIAIGLFFHTLAAIIMTLVFSMNLFSQIMTSKPLHLPNKNKTSKHD